MNYLVKWCKHNCIFFALSTLVATFAAAFSVKHFLLLAFMMVWLIFRMYPKPFIIAIIVWSVFCYGLFELRLVNDHEPLQLPTQLTWTSKYKINGNELRGFMKTENGERIYVVYQLHSEQEKDAFMARSLAGQVFEVLEADWENVKQSSKAHDYSFSMATYLKGMNAKGTLNIQQQVHVDTKHSIPSVLAQYRFTLNRHIERTFPDSLVAEAQSLLFGDQQHVDKDMNRAYQKLGITHLFAISGLHVALLSILLFEGLLRIGVRRQLAQLIIIVALPIYAVLAGGAPSVWRAVLLVEILYAVKAFNGRLGVDDALSIAFILSVLWQPSIVLQVGFQLSYLACASLVYGQKMLQSCSYWWQQGFVMTFLCQLLAYPILLYHFYEISLSSFLANIVFVPLFSFVVLPINVLLLVVSFISPTLSNLFFSIYEPVRTLLAELILQMQQVPYQLWIPGKPTTIIVMLMMCSVLASFVLWEKNKRVVACFVCLLPPLLFSFKYVLQTDLIVTFVDVGQGDCIVIELPRRQAVYMIDSGGLLRFGEDNWAKKSNSYEIGRQVVVPFLKGKGISHIDFLILSHADADHVEGAEEILEEIRATEIHITPNSASNESMEDVLAVAASKNIPIVEKMKGQAWQQGGATFKYVWPVDTTYEGNNDSLVLHLQFNQFSALFTGDLEEAGELQLVNMESTQPLTLLKAGHHGSKTSSSEQFIDYVKPMLTIFMAGTGNRYNHPHPDVVERFHSRGFTTISTKEYRSIEVKTDGLEMTVRTMQ